ncbi:MAG: hypothetical protein Q7U54_04405 [Bacteroidales bacterium]|nr:hypothetical protein [Bacteroidales bacterium]
MDNSTNFFAIISGLVIAIITVWILIYALFRFYKFLFKNKNIFGDTIETRIVGLGITGLFFPYGLKLIFLHPIQILLQSLSLFYSGINSIVARNTTDQNEFFSILSRMFSSAMENFNNWFQFYSIGVIFLTLAAWSLAGRFIDSYKTSEVKGPNKPEHDILRQNIVLVLIFLLSIYLSLAAIITVPYFTENKDQQLKEEPLKDQLDRIRERYEKNTFSSFSPDKPIFQIDSALLGTISKIRNEQIKNNATQVYKSWNENYERNIKTRKDIEDRLIQENEAFKTKLTDEETKVVSTYSTESFNLKSKLKLSFSNSLVEYYKNFMQSYINRTAQIRAIVKLADDEFKRDLFSFSQDFSDYVTKASRPDSTNTHLEDKFEFYPYNRTYYLGMEYFSMDNYSIQLPTVPTPGDELGIFKGIAQWLIKPYSMALVLIVGMLGFGLFGAVISTFVKEEKASPELKEHGIIINDVTGVIIRGVSAAIVIFLGVKGGLAVFSTGEGEPNPYALFFTCLVGAVYSERIWEWAKEKLTSKLNLDLEKAKTDAALKTKEAAATAAKASEQASANKANGITPTDKDV